MYSKEEYNKVIDNIKKTIGEQNAALINDDIANLITNYDVVLEDMKVKDDEISKIKNDNDELLKVNGKLFQKVTSKVEDNNIVNDDNNNNSNTNTIKLDDIFDKSGNFID